jgi:hypothetical protein
VGSAPWLWHDGQLTTLPPISTDTQGHGTSTASLLNDNGWVAGQGATYNDAGQKTGQVGILWHDGNAWEIPAIAHGTSSGYATVTAINAAGQVLGSTENYDAAGNSLGNIAFFYDAGITTYLTVPGFTASGTSSRLTDDGSVFLSYHIQSADGSVQRNQAYFWRADLGIIPLDDMIVGGIDHSHWDHLIGVSAISDNGLWLSGSGMTVQGNTEAFVLQLAPEPASLLLLAPATLMFFPRRRLQRHLI